MINFAQLYNDYQKEIGLLELQNISLRNKYLHLRQILERSCKELTISESLQFPSLFSRLVFLSQKYSLPKSLERNIQQVRILSNFLLRDEKNLVSETQLRYAEKSLEQLLSFLAGNKIEAIPTLKESTKPNVLHFDKLRVQVKSIDWDKQLLVCHAENFFEDDILVRFGHEKVNKDFNPTIENIWIGAQLNLLNVRENQEGFFIPKSFILEPDYLIDASAIAECFQTFAKSHLQYFRRKFEPPANSHYILMGNLANFFLDEIIYADDIDALNFNDVFLKSFAQMPFEYSSCGDIQEPHAFREFMIRAQGHFNNIKRVVKNDMAQSGFDRQKCTLEPSFFSEKYGFQGRLDLLQTPIEPDDKFRIIELKSGKAPFPASDTTRIGLNHEVQTIVYRLMIQSVFGKDTRDVYPTILYSSVDNSYENLRLAAHYQKLENEILNVRNLIVATEQKLYRGGIDAVANVFEETLDAGSYEGNKPDFFKEKLKDLAHVLHGISDVERLYFYRFINFISREVYLLKTGDEGAYTAMSQSALWNKTFEERKNALELISNLSIEKIEDNEHDMLIHFAREGEETSSNFREGEICILYPREKEEDTTLSNQILKGIVVELSNSHLVLRFRYKQQNKDFFEKHRSWAVEHDKLDHSYNAMYGSLFAFLSAPKSIRNLLLGLESPHSNTNIEVSDKVLSIKEKQELVLKKALVSEDYFLIVGPPGTGKTSVFARQLIERLYTDDDANILVIAYTNRAVDELCAAICAAFDEREDDCQKYIRIGSSLSCSDNYRHRLLQNISYKVKSRKELSDQIKNTRIFVGTLASIVGKPELFSLKKFQTAIIDEASQILEPQIIGLLPQFDRFIMIGDHKQLSTITLQNTVHSKVNEPELNQIGLFDCRNSLFERLYQTCKTNGWNQAFETLNYHGRMHTCIADFVNQTFYNQALLPINERQSKPLVYNYYDNTNPLENLIANKRMAFLHITKKDWAQDQKVNKEEAHLVVSIASSLVCLYKNNAKVFDSDKTLGIITPYRNQIALIKEELRRTNIAELQNIMVDTVERFQGSQRDVIIVSFCMDRDYQLSYFCNLNEDKTVDRKLNVALTRAREQLFLIGNEDVLRVNPIYHKLLEFLK